MSNIYGGTKHEMQVLRPSSSRTSTYHLSMQFLLLNIGLVERIDNWRNCGVSFGSEF